MSEKYKTHSDGLYFVSFSVVGWLNVFTKRIYQDILVESINFCKQNKELKIYSYCIMPSHVYFVSYSENGSLSNILRDLKSYTANQLIKAIEDNSQESKKELFLKLFRHFGGKRPQKQKMQFWKHDNHPFFLYSNKMIDQKIDYIHNNPVVAGFVNHAYEWRLSSANEFSPIKVDVL